MSGGLSHEGGGIGRRLPQYMIARSAYYAQVCLPKPPTRQRQHARATAHMHAPALELHFADGMHGAGVRARHWPPLVEQPVDQVWAAPTSHFGTRIRARQDARKRACAPTEVVFWHRPLAGGTFQCCASAARADDPEPFFPIDPIEGAM